MQDYSNMWNGYLEFWQRSWLEMNRLWFPALPDMSGQSKDSGKEKGALAPNPFASLSPENWMALFTPWMPKVEANIEPFMEEAAKVSMRVFMPWQSDPLWVEALVGKQEQGTTGKTPGKTLPAKKGFVETTQNPAELEVNEAIKRSRTQD